MAQTPEAATHATKPKPSGFRERRRESMLRTAAQVLYDVGLRQTTMEDIAKALKTSKIAIYRYFPNKEELIEAVLREQADVFVADEHESWSGLKRALRRALENARSNPPAFLLMTRAAASDPELRRHYDRVRSTAEEATRRRLRLLEHPICADALMLDVFSRALIELLFNALAHWLEAGDEARDGEWLQHMAAAATRMVDWDGRTVGVLPPVLAPDEME